MIKYNIVYGFFTTVIVLCVVMVLGTAGAVDRNLITFGQGIIHYVFLISTIATCRIVTLIYKSHYIEWSKKEKQRKNYISHYLQN